MKNAVLVYMLNRNTHINVRLLMNVNQPVHKNVSAVPLEHA